MKQNRIYTALLLLGLLLGLPVGFTACQTEDADKQEREKKLTLSLEIAGNNNGNGNDYITYATYAMPTDESKIEHLTVLAFKTDPLFPTDVAKGTFLYRASVSYNANPTSCIVKVKDMADAQTFVIIANARTAVDNTLLQEGTTKAQVIEKLTQAQTVAFDPTAMTSIPMWGEVHNKVVNNGVVPLGLNCKLYRSLAKINVRVDAAIPATNFQLRSVRLYMPRQKVALIPNNWGAYTPQPGETTPPDEAVSTPTEPATSIPIRGANYTYTTTTNRVVDQIYTVEARNAGLPAVPHLDKVCLVVGGWYDNDNTKEYYYRIDLKIGATQLDILRNFIYNINITQVSGMGTETPDDAHKGISTIKADVEAWNQANGDAYFEQNRLSVSNRYPFINRSGTAVTNSNVIKIKTTDPTGWKIENLPAWATASQLTGATNVEATIIITGTATTVGRDAGFKIVSGNLTYTATVLQDNCGRKGIAMLQRIGTKDYLTHVYNTKSGTPQCWMVENSKEGNPFFKSYGLDIPIIGIDPDPNDECYYRDIGSGDACPSPWRVPTHGEANSLATLLPSIRYTDMSRWWYGSPNNRRPSFTGYTNQNLQALGGWIGWGERLYIGSFVSSSYRTLVIKSDGTVSISSIDRYNGVSVRCVTP